MATLSELSDGFEPHDHITPAVLTRARDTVLPGGEGCTRGGGDGLGGWGGLYRYPPTAIPGPIFRLIPGIRPYPRPNEGNLWTQTPDM